MGIIISAITAMGSKMLTYAIIEKVTILLLEELVKRSDSKADDKLLEILKEGLK